MIQADLLQIANDLVDLSQREGVTTIVTMIRGPDFVRLDNCKSPALRAKLLREAMKDEPDQPPDERDYIGPRKFDQ